MNSRMGHKETFSIIKAVRKFQELKKMGTGYYNPQYFIINSAY